MQQHPASQSPLDATAAAVANTLKLRLILELLPAASFQQTTTTTTTTTSLHASATTTTTTTTTAAAAASSSSSSCNNQTKAVLKTTTKLMEALHNQELQATKDIIMNLQLQQLLTMQKTKKKPKLKQKKYKNATPTSKPIQDKKTKKKNTTKS